jgi:hypothetical protein
VRVAAAAAAGALGVPILPATQSGASSLLPADRTIDWSRVGIPGGIPSRGWPVAVTLSPNGTEDDSIAIQTALNEAPPHTVVLLGPGVYRLHRGSAVGYGHADDYPGGVFECGLYLNRPVVLRGAGPDRTILTYGDGANIVSIGNTYLSAKQVRWVDVVSGATQGSSTLRLGGDAGLTAGSYLVVTGGNPLDSDGRPLVDVHGYGGESASGHDLPDHAMTQVERVTAVEGQQVTLERPLYISFVRSPRIYPLPGLVEGAGLENLRLQSTAPSGRKIVFKNINMESCSRCWVVDCESDMAVDRAHVYLSDCYGCEIRNNFLNDAYNHDSGSNYAVFLEFRNSENLVENNIIRRARHSLIMNGGSGNVFAYNYAVDAFMGEYPNSLPETVTHAAHPFMNLWEGNVLPNLEFDFTHGSSSHNTVFRNYLSMRSTNPVTGGPMTGALFALTLSYGNPYETAVGNVLGTYGAPCPAVAYQVDADAPRVPSIYKLGNFDDGDTRTPSGALSAKVERTSLRGGNWDALTRTVVWRDNVPSGSLASSYLPRRSLPASLFRNAAPPEFRIPGAVWPAVDPLAAVKYVPIPAQRCYAAEGLGKGGVFDPSYYRRWDPAAEGPPAVIRADARGSGP